MKKRFNISKYFRKLKFKNIYLESFLKNNQKVLSYVNFFGVNNLTIPGKSY